VITISAQTKIDATITLPGLRASVPCARRWVSKALTGHPLADNARLIITELAANAVKHTRSNAKKHPRGRFDVHLFASETDVRIEVTDDGSDTSPAPMAASVNAECWRGLAIVQALATAWGTRPTGARRTVWAELHELEC
jgi:anti-sigma regulatory factor (Ser/Thr protein kinase)